MCVSFFIYLFIFKKIRCKGKMGKAENLCLGSALPVLCLNLEQIYIDIQVNRVRISLSAIKHLISSEWLNKPILTN